MDNESAVATEGWINIKMPSYYKTISIIKIKWSMKIVSLELESYIWRDCLYIDSGPGLIPLSAYKLQSVWNWD